MSVSRMSVVAVGRFLAATVGAIVSTLILPIVLLIPILALFGPVIGAWSMLPSGIYNIGGAIATCMATIFASYQFLLKPRYDESKPGSRYCRRHIGVVGMLSLQVIFALIVYGPLRIAFFGHDPIGLVAWFQRKIRDLDTSILRVRPPIYPVNERGRDITIPLRDDVETAATLYSPQIIADGKKRFDDTPRPVILIRTPYNRDSLARWGVRFAERGYHLVAQDTRGRFGSTGDFFPMLNEARDGAATVEWIERQQWCNGRVGMTGMSYLGLCAWAAMREQVPALKAVAPIMAATDLYNVMFGRGSGAVHVELLFRWSHLVMHLMCKPFGMMESMFTFFWGTGKALRNAYKHAPLREADTLYLVPNSEPLEWFQDGFNHPLGTEKFWDDKHFIRFEEMKRIPPVLLFCGWYDFFGIEMMHDYQAVRKLNDDCRMVVGPYTHWHVMSMQPKLFRSLLDFMDRHLLEDSTARDLPPVDAFAMGANMGWMQLKSWPAPNADKKEFTFVRSKGGELQIVDDRKSKNFGESEASYVYDPSDPTPQVGGATFNPSNCGRLRQNEIESRDDVLVFTSKPLERPMLIAGEITVHLEVESNVEGTDYVARACHVTGDGNSVNIADGIIRRFDLKPGGRTKVDITLSPVLNRLAVGDCLRIQICSSAYPKYGRHLNTRESFHLEVEKNAIISEQILFVGGTNGCKVVVPSLPSDYIE